MGAGDIKLVIIYNSLMLPKVIKSILNMLIVLAVRTLLGKLFQIGTILLKVIFSYVIVTMLLQ